MTSIKFSKLTDLTLTECHIDSLEAMTRFYIPLLKILYIHYNRQIVFVKELKKVNFPELNYTSMRNFDFNKEGNAVNEGESFSRMLPKNMGILNI